MNVPDVEDLRTHLSSGATLKSWKEDRGVIDLSLPDGDPPLNETLATLDQTMLEPTQLTHERQLELQAQFQRFLAAVGDSTPR